jgi:hypothetical protein
MDAFLSTLIGERPGFELAEKEKERGRGRGGVSGWEERGDKREKKEPEIKSKPMNVD